MLVFLFSLAILGLAAADEKEVKSKDTTPTTPKITTTVATPESAKNQTIPLIVPKEGDVCNLMRLPRLTEKAREYLECVKPKDPQWAWEGIGTWEKKSCPKGKAFSPVSRSCKNANAVRRMYQRNCANYGGCHQVYQPCQAGACGQQQQGAWTSQQPAQWVNLPQPVQPCQSPAGCQPQVIQPQPQPIVQPAPIVHPVQPVVHQPYVEPMIHQQIVHPPIVEPQVIHQPYVHPQPVVTHIQHPAPVVQTIHPVVEPVQPYVQPPVIQPQPIVHPMPSHIHTDCGAGTTGFVGCNPEAYHQPIIAPRPCPSAPIRVTHQDVQTGSPCSWMSAPLVQAPSHTDYFQCQPTKGNFYCGQWQQQSCGQQQVFNPQVQVCAPSHVDITAVQHPQPVQGVHYIHQPAPVPAQPSSSCAQNYVPIGQCNVQGQCPGFSNCQQGTCCQNVQNWHG